MDQDLELEEQLKMLEGVNIESNPMIQTTQSVVNTIPTPTNPVEINQQISNMEAAAQVVTPSQTVSPNPVYTQATVMKSEQVQQNIATSQPVQTSPAPQPKVDLDAAPVFVSVTQDTTTQTDYLKLKEGEMTKVALINYNASQTYFHYEQGLGYFKCLSTYNPGSDWPEIKGCCCLQPNPNDRSKVVGKGKKRIFLPVVEYPVAHTDGKTPVAGGTPKLKILALNTKEWSAIAEFKDAYPEASMVDLFIKRKKDESNFLTYAVTPFPTVRAQYQGLVEQEVSKLNNRVYNLAAEEYAKTLSEERVRNFYDEKIKQEIAVQQLATQQQNIPSIDQLGI